MSRVRGGSACGPSTLWRSEVAVLAVRRRSHLVVLWSRQNSALVVLVEVLLGPTCIVFVALLAAVFSLMVCVFGRLGVHSGEGSSQDRPLSLLVEVFPRSALCLFWATVVLPCGSKCVVWLGCVLERFSQDGSWRFWSRDELPLLPVGLSVLQFAWALLVKHRVLVLECFGFVPSGAWVHCVVPWVAPGAGDSTMCCAGCLFVRFVCRLTTSLGVGGVELSASGTLCAGLCLVPYRWYARLWSWPVSQFSLSLRERVCLAVVPCFGLGPSEVDVLSSTSEVVSVPVWLHIFVVVGTCAERCFHFVPDSVGFCGSRVCGSTSVVVMALCCSLPLLSSIML
ncbi:hypothetical protein Taro_022188 [Colocasia esculenta]|uniref:Uncharacterized protein n=1 Tax=Colocasia esculenta TaxID=4460 RepID=A0A843V0T1_COLES|nr:hypothetical protein [Colocasia esculenta]